MSHIIVIPIRKKVGDAGFRFKPYGREQSLSSKIKIKNLVVYVFLFMFIVIKTRTQKIIIHSKIKLEYRVVTSYTRLMFLTLEF